MKNGKLKKQLERSQGINLLLFIGLVATVTLLLITWFGYSPQDKLQTIDPSLRKVISVHDGDTITVDINGQNERIRLLAIDTPETHHPEIGAECYGTEAGKYLTQIIGDSRIKLEADPKADNRDYYDRLLRYVYLPDGTNVNQKMVEDGYALAYTGFSNTQTPKMLELEEQARDQQRGLWASCEVTSDGRTWTTQQLETDEPN